MANVNGTYMGKQGYPSNMGKKWKSVEDELLMREITAKLTKQQIANTHKRTVGSVRSRISKLAYDEYKRENQTIEHIIQKYNILESVFRQFITNSEIKEQIKADKKAARALEKKKKQENNPSDKRLYSLFLEFDKKGKHKDKKEQPDINTFDERLYPLFLEIRDIMKDIRDQVKIFTENH